MTKKGFEAARRTPRVGSWELLVDTNELTWSADTYEIFGVMTVGGGTREAFIARVHPDDREMLNEVHRRRLSSSDASECEYRIVRDDGDVRRLRERGEHQDADAHHPRRVWGTVQDITPSIRSADELGGWEAMNRMAGRLGHIGAWALNIGDNRLILSTQACIIHGVDPGYTPTLDEAIDFYAPEYRDAVRRAVQACIDAGSAFDFEAEAIDAVGRHIRVRAIGEAERDDAGAVTRIHGALQEISRRKHVEATLRDSLSALREANRVARIGTWERNLDEGTSLWSLELYAILGARPSEFPAGPDTFIEFVHPDDREYFASNYARLTRDGARAELEHRIVRVDGAVRWVLSRAEAIPATDASPARIVGTTQDVTDARTAALERHVAALEIERLNRLYAALSQVRRTMVRIDSRDELLAAICAILVTEGGFPMAWVGWHDAATHRLDAIAVAGDRDGYLDHVHVYTDERPEGRGPAGRAFRERRPVVVHDLLADDSTGPWRQAMERHGFRGVAVFPIYEMGQPCGVLVVYAEQPGAFQSHEVALIEAVAADLSAALDSFEQGRELEAERSRLAEAQAIAHVGSWETDMATGEVRWSDETHRIFETDPSTFRPTHAAFLAVVHPDDRAMVDAAFAESDGSGAEYDIEHRLLLPDGRVKNIHEHWRVVLDEYGIPTRALGTAQDVTTRERAERSLRLAADENLRLARGLSATLESITDAFYTLDCEWRFTYVNHEAERIMRHPRSELLGRSIRDVFPDLNESQFGREFERAMNDHVSVKCEAYYPPLSAWFEARAFPSSQGLAVYFRDTTTERQSAVQLRALAMKVEAVQDAERSTLAREVHDGLGQALTVLRMDASRLARMTTANAAAALVTEMTEAIDRALQEARSIALALHPTALDDLGLNAAVEMHAQQVARRGGFALALELAPTSLHLDRARARAIYRVLQESLTNVVRHAAATSVVVRLGQVGDDVELEVLDNGRGMVRDAARDHPSLGLLGMRERAAAFGGSLHVGPSPTGGTRVMLRLPMP